MSEANSVPCQAGLRLTSKGAWAGPPEPSVVRGFLRVTDGGGSTTRQGLTQSYSLTVATQAIERGRRFWLCG
jgi:hypothetical protein